MYVYKCKNCDDGPCYFHTGKKDARGGMFGEFGNCDQPYTCPRFGNQETPDWEVLQSPCGTIGDCEMIVDWMGMEVYDNAPEELRDAICGCGFEPRGLATREALRIIGVIREYEANRHDWIGETEREEWLKQFNKINKWELLNAIFPEAFKAGIVYGEKLRQEREAQND